MVCWFYEILNRLDRIWIPTAGKKKHGISGLDLKCNTAGQEGHWSQLPIPALENKAAFLQGPKQM